MPALAINESRDPDAALHARALRGSFARLLATLTDADGAPFGLHFERWRSRIRRARDLGRLRFDASGVRLANNVRLAWSARGLALPALPAVLTTARDYARHALYAASHGDVCATAEALVSRGLGLPCHLGDDARAWWRSCPQHGTPACTYGDLPPKPSCAYCRGAGFLTAANPSSVMDLVDLHAHGDAVRRAEHLVCDALPEVRVERVAWASWSSRDLANVYRRERFYAPRDTPEGEAVARSTRWASKGRERPGDEAPALRDLDALGFHLLDAHRGTIILGVGSLWSAEEPQS